MLYWEKTIHCEIFMAFSKNAFCYTLLRNLAIGSVLSLSALPVYAAKPSPTSELEELRQRIDDLEELLIDMESRRDGAATANSFDAISLNIGGYYHGVAREFDTDNGDVSAFTRNILYLRIEADLSEHWNLSFGNMFGQIDIEQPELTALDAGYLDASAAITPATMRSSSQNNFNQILNQNRITTLESYNLNFPLDVNLKYQHNDALRLVLGRQRAPVGYTSFHPTTWRNNEMPRYMLSTNGVSHIFKPFVQGVTVEGFFYPGDGEHIIAYHAFAGDTLTVDSDFSSTVNDDQSSFRLSYTKPNQSFSVGLNYIHGKRENRNFYGGNRFAAAGLDLYINHGPWRWHSEYYGSQEKNSPDRRGYFIQPSLALGERVELAVSHDVMDAPIYTLANPAYTSIVDATQQQLSNAGQSPAAIAATISTIPRNINAPSNAGKSIENTISLNYTPIETIRLRLQYSKRVYRDLGNYTVGIAAFSATASF